ncbi:unnamed protein product [Nesidiocoris tenuis]|uniref:Uncharacterized protein n=1 Tax=Nesidiocoris tenuis TaxID=355587 RepID=A0A6H5HFW7_9HEMI|nr:unnamed protein product [Nesidiocoris tenuis]
MGFGKRPNPSRIKRFIGCIQRDPPVLPVLTRTHTKGGFRKWVCKTAGQNHLFGGRAGVVLRLRGSRVQAENEEPDPHPRPPPGPTSVVSSYEIRATRSPAFAGPDGYTQLGDKIASKSANRPGKLLKFSQLLCRLGFRNLKSNPSRTANKNRAKMLRHRRSLCAAESTKNNKRLMYKNWQQISISSKTFHKMYPHHVPTRDSHLPFKHCTVRHLRFPTVPVTPSGRSRADSEPTGRLGGAIIYKFPNFPLLRCSDRGNRVRSMIRPTSFLDCY